MSWFRSRVQVAPHHHMGHVTHEASDLAAWIGWDGIVSHPEAAAGGGGPGFFRTPGPLGMSPMSVRLVQPPPHPRAPAARHLHVAAKSAVQEPTLAPRIYDLRDVIFRFEAQKGHSNHLHWPGGSSGITLGPGYDFKTRDSKAVINDLVAIGLPKTTAEEAAKGCGKSGKDAQAFAALHRKLINLTEEQEKQLLGVVLPDYERAVDGLVKVRVNANQRVALVSLTYNIGVKHFTTSRVLDKLNRGDYDGARKAFALWVRSGGEIAPGLVKRRQREMDIFSTPVPPVQRVRPPIVMP